MPINTSWTSRPNISGFVSYTWDNAPDNWSLALYNWDNYGITTIGTQWTTR